MDQHEDQVMEEEEIPMPNVDHNTLNGYVRTVENARKNLPLETTEQSEDE
jgi:hypothetical protein